MTSKEWSQSVAVTNAFVDHAARGSSPEENHFYALYNTLLSELFPMNTDFMCSAEHRTNRKSDGLFYVVRRLPDMEPFMFLIVRAPSFLTSIDGRRAVDEEMRKTILEFSLDGNMRVPKFYGISAIGRQLCCYTYDKTTGIVNPAETSNIDPIPIDRWSSFVMDEEGYTLMNGIKDEIMEMANHVELGDLSEQGDPEEWSIMSTLCVGYVQALCGLILGLILRPETGLWHVFVKNDI